MRNFKRILKTAAVFLLLVSLFSAFFIACYLRGENFHYQDGRERDALAGELRILVVGASYSLFGIQPEVLNERVGTSAYNLSGTLLTLRGRYTLLRQELERNPKVYRVLIEVSPDTLLRDREEEGGKGDLPMLGRLTDSAARWDYFREAFSVSEWPEVYYDLVSKGIESALRLVTGSYTTENEIMVLGYYENRNPDKPIPNNYAELYAAQRLPEEIDPENVAWLEKLIELCRDHGAEPILLTTPQSKYYNCVFANLDYYQTWYEDFAKAQGVAYYNFNLAKAKLERLPDESCFYDTTHLNAEGGRIFTQMLAELLNLRHRNGNTRALFYSSYEELTHASHYFQ